MVPKRQLHEVVEEGSDLPTGRHKHRRQFLASWVDCIFKGENNARTLQEFVPCLEPMIRKYVQEAVDDAMNSFLNRSSLNRIGCSGSRTYQIECSGSRTYQLQFESNLPRTLFTNSKVMSEDRSPIKIVLCDSSSKAIAKSGPLSSVKVNIVVLDGDFCPDDSEDWAKKDFDKKIVQNREGKRPLVTGELIVPLQDGVGYIGDVSFTDNSSWIRSGKFRLGATVQTGHDNVRIREGMTNAFKVKDHRGESYQKHYPPSLDDEVWRLEKIAKDGPSHKRLTQFGISTVRDFLRKLVTDKLSLRNVLRNISNKTWETIIGHATKCTLDDKRYIYRNEDGTGLLFNSIYKVLGMTFDGQNFQSLEHNNTYQMRLVEELKQQAYKNSKDWILVGDTSIFGYPMLLTSLGAHSSNNPNLDLQDSKFHGEQDQLEMPINPDPPTISPAYNCEVERDYSSYENHLGESSHQNPIFNPTFRTSFGMNDTLGGFHTWPSMINNYMGAQLSTDDLPIDENFQVETSACYGNGFFLGSGNHEIISSDSGIPVPRNWSPKTGWCMVLAVVKWRILVRRNVAAKKWKNLFYNYV